MRKKDPELTHKIFQLKQQNPKLSDRAVARMLNINPMTVNKHRRSTEYMSLAHHLAQSNAKKIQEQIDAAHEVIMYTLGERDEEGKPTKAAVSMAARLGNTQSAKLMSTKADKEEVEDKTLEDKKNLLNELIGLPGYKLPEASN